MKRKGFTFTKDEKTLRPIICEVYGEMEDGTRVWKEIDGQDDNWYSLRVFKVDGKKVNIFILEGV